jgi:CBS domain containing-hemolysin-like protein
VIGLSGLLIAILAVPVLALHLASIALTKALQSYSRSRLEEYCADRGRPERADEVARLDERAEHSAEAIAVLTGLFLAALCGVALDQWGRPASAEILVLIVLLVGGAGYVLAGVLGEVLAEPILYAFWPAVPAVLAVAWPLTRGYAGLRFLVERLAGNHESGPRPASVEVEIPAEEGDSSDDIDAELPEGTRALVQRAVELSRTDVSEIMRPSAAIVSLPATVTAQAAAEAFRRTGRSRIPLYGTNRDDIVGILLGKDLWDRMIEAEDADAVVPAGLVRPAFFVPETANALQLIEDLRGNRTQMAIVLDEYGGVAGLVTLEDLLEKLVGPIDDEHDIPTPDDPIRPLGGSRYEVDATLPLEVLNDRLDLDLPTDEEFQTIGGLALHALGRLPERGARFRHDGIEFTILDVQEHSIRRVLIDLQPAASIPDGH